MELSPKSEIVWQISKQSGKASFAVGFAEGYVCINHQVRLIMPFVAMPLHCGPGMHLCRGPWPYERMFSIGKYSFRPCPAEPWMALDAADLVRVHDLVCDLRIEVPREGYRRDFNR